MRQAVAHLVDRDSIQKVIHGRGGVATSNLLVNPAAFTSSRVGLAFDIAKAKTLLIRLNDRVCNDHTAVPIVMRPNPGARVNHLHAPISSWATESSGIQDGYRA